MKGSKVANISLDPAKQKIVECSKCGVPLVVGKFAKNEQTCESANQFPSNSKCKPKDGKNKSAKDKIKIVKESAEQSSVRRLDKSEDDSFGAKFTKLMNQLEFEIDNKRRYKKRYGIDGGGVAVIYPYVGKDLETGKPKVEYFSMIIQRAVGINEDFRRFMPPDAASDCELIASEFGEQVLTRPEVGTVRCDGCGVITDEFGVDPKKNKVLCVRPNNCFKKAFTTSGAEAAE